MKEAKVLIIGYGIVGHNLYKELNDLKPFIYDKYKSEYSFIGRKHYDVGFICVDTPLLKGDSGNYLDTTEVVNALISEEYYCDIYVIKSTCPVGTIDTLTKLTGKHIVFSPEYYGNTKHCNNYNFDFTILGGDKKDCEKVIQTILPCYDGRHVFKIVDAKTAELVKFMENSWIATKVSFCNSFYNICKETDINYSELRELFVLDPRVNPAHTFVYEDSPYWDSHCLNKDVPSIAEQFDNKLLKDVIEYNKNQKKKNYL